MNYTEFTKSRRLKEKIAVNILKSIAMISILTTIAILFFLFYETFNFFKTIGIETNRSFFLDEYHFLSNLPWPFF